MKTTNISVTRINDLNGADLSVYSVKPVISLLSVVFSVSQEYSRRIVDWGASISPCCYTCAVIPNKQIGTVSHGWVSQNNKSIFKTITHAMSLYWGPATFSVTPHTRFSKHRCLHYTLESKPISKTGILCWGGHRLGFFTLLQKTFFTSPLSFTSSNRAPLL